jgi:hypothetical protein
MLVESPSAWLPVYAVLSLAGWGMDATSTLLFCDVAIAYDCRTSHGRSVDPFCGVQPGACLGESVRSSWPHSLISECSNKLGSVPKVLLPGWLSNVEEARGLPALGARRQGLS